MPELESTATEPVSEPQQSEPIPEPVNEPTSDTESANQSEISPELSSDGIGLDRNGEVHFGDDFFKGLGGELERKPEPEQPQEPQPTPVQATEPVQFYTPDDLAHTPLLQVEEGRLPDSVRPFFPIVRQQMLMAQQQVQQYAAQVQQLQQALAQQTPQVQEPQEPKELTPDEIVQIASANVAKTLGVPVDELDALDTKTSMLLNLEAQKAQAQRQGEIQNFRVQRQARQQLSSLYSTLRTRDDFPDIDAHLTKTLMDRGIPPQYLLQEVGRTGDYASALQFILSELQRFEGARAVQQQRQAQVAKPMPTPVKPVKVPFVESAGNAAPNVKKRIDPRQFGKMSEEQQVQALIDAGLCDIAG